MRNLNKQIALAKSLKNAEDVPKCVRDWIDDFSSPLLMKRKRKIKKWWWRHYTGAYMLTLKIGKKDLPLGNGKNSIEVGHIEDLVDTLQTVHNAVLNGELDWVIR